MHSKPTNRDGREPLCVGSQRKRGLRGSLLFLLSSGGGGLLGGLLERRLGLDAREDLEVGVALTDWLDQTTLYTVADQSTGDRAVDLELFAERGAGNAEDLCHFLRNLFVAFLVEEHIVVKLVLDLDLGPALLFSLTAFLRCLSYL